MALRCFGTTAMDAIAATLTASASTLAAAATTTTNTTTTITVVVIVVVVVVVACDHFSALRVGQPKPDFTQRGTLLLAVWLERFCSIEIL
mmetsp:Transcript_27944/g.60156  ORF Transcript_27944/g.60156 Transcript_27944/m.60156 type:complete len:90 (+) Transcript_27944:515-784(+)